VKGIGGYHIACLADNESAVRALRDRKRRPDKPFALMVPSVEWAHRLVVLDSDEEALLTSRERPIALARRRNDAPVASAVAPRSVELGLMLPYSPLHHLLLHDVGVPLVMTSGNLTDEPIAFRDDDARARLGGIVDAFLVHDREIAMPTDDSVLRVVSCGGRRATMVRRSRGYAPAPMPLPIASPEPLLACGAQLKNTYGLAIGARAWIGPHVGDLANYDALDAFVAGIAHHETLFGVTPTRIASDRHPEYLSTKYAMARVDAGFGAVSEPVQHHHAHLAAVLAEHGEQGLAIGLIFDGTGMGEVQLPGGTASAELWGGELLVGDLVAYERVGHLLPVRMPGGESAIREPWRMACSWLAAASSEGIAELPATLRDRVENKAWQATTALVRSGVASPWTTSAGRLFDALSALCGVCATSSYEGQAAIEFEAIADRDEVRRYTLPLIDDRGSSCTILDARELVRCALRDVESGVSVAAISARAHNGMAYAAAQACRAIANHRGVRTVVLSGGVFQNTLLVERTAAQLRDGGLRVLLPERLPCNDGGIAFGQLAIAAARAAAATAVVPVVAGRDAATSFTH
jgi:hydrogenase maturation protein HypF